MADMTVQFVTPESEVWSGKATMVVAKTMDGELGIQAGHEPVLGELAPSGTVTVYSVDEGVKIAAVHGGFISVGAHGVTVLAESSEWAADIDRAAVEKALAEAKPGSDEAAVAHGRLRALDKKAAV